MKKMLLLLSCSAALLLYAAELPFSIEPKNPRKCEIGKTSVTEMVRNGNILFELVVPKTASPSAKFAGQEAAEQLSRAFGSSIAVRNAPSGRNPAVIIGDAELAGKLGIDLKNFDRDGFVIRTHGKNVLIIGRDDPKLDPRRAILMPGLKGEMATLFGTYDFLERFAGIRYYFPGKIGTVIPKRKDWALPEIDIYDRPDFIQRRFNDNNHGGRPIHYYEGADWKKTGGVLNKLRNRHETFMIPNVHGLAYYGYQYRFGKEHPEYFALDGAGKRIMGRNERHDRSQICFSSGIKEEIIADAVSFLKGEPASVRGIRTWNDQPGWSKWLCPSGLPLFNIMPNDSCYPCRCPECWKHFSQPEQAQSNYIWSFFADICNGVKKSGVPGWLTTMAYAQYRPIPKVEIPDNLLVMLALRGPWNEGNPILREQDDKLLQAWKKKLRNKTWLWTYPGKYYGMFPGIPHTTPRAAASFTKRAAPHIFGIFFECESDYVIFNYLTYHVYGKIMWNPNTDVEKLLDEHAQIMYGPAAEPMKEYFDSVERNWMKIAANVIETPMGPKTIYPSELELWGSIYSPMEIKRLNGLFDQAEKLCAKAPEYLERVKFLRKEMFAPLLGQLKRFQEANNSTDHWKAFCPERSGEVKIDGLPEEAAWRNATEFYLSPLGGEKPAEVKTVVRAMCDRENFYFAFECEEPDLLFAGRRKFDEPELWKDSDVEIFLSPDGNRKRYYQFMLNAHGDLADLRVVDSVTDFSWNSGAEVKTAAIPGKKWTAEIRLPRKSMEPVSGDSVLANFTRHRVLDGKKTGTPYYSWSPFARSFGDITRFGKLVFTLEPADNLIADGVFSVPATEKTRYWWGKWTSTSKRFNRDERYFVSGGASARLENSINTLCQYVPLKPDTEYVISFLAKMKDVKKLEPNWSGFYVRIDPGNGKALYYPAAYGIQLTGSCPWTRMEHRFRTPKDTGSKSKPYINFILRKAEGAVWIDDVKLSPAGTVSALKSAK